MRRKAHLAFRQQQPRIAPQPAVQPWVGGGGFRPCALVQPTKDDQPGALYPRLLHAKDLHARVRQDGTAGLFPRQNGGQQRSVIAGRQHQPLRRFGGQRLHRTHCAFSPASRDQSAPLPSASGPRASRSASAT